jgi:hypothetical protein
MSGGSRKKVGRLDIGCKKKSALKPEPEGRGRGLEGTGSRRDREYGLAFGAWGRPEREVGGKRGFMRALKIEGTTTSNSEQLAV